MANIGGFLALLTNVTNLFDTGHLTDVPKKKGLVLGNALAFIWGAVSALILVVVFVVAVPEEKVQAILLAIAGGIFGRAVIEKVVRKKLQDLFDEVLRLEDEDIRSDKVGEYREQKSCGERRDQDN